MTPSEEWDRSAPWVYETAAPDWVSELARELPNRRRARGIELDPDDQYYPSEDDFDDEPSSPDDWYTPHDAPLRHPGSAGIRSVPDEPPARTRRGAGRDDGRALPDWADGAAFSARADEAARSAGAGDAGRYRPEHRFATGAFAADELAPRRRRRAAPEPGAHDPDDRSWRLDDHPPVRRPPIGAVDGVRADGEPVDDATMDDGPMSDGMGGPGGIGGPQRGRDPYRRQADEAAGWSPPDAGREQRMASHPSQYVDRPATGRARVPQPRADDPRADNPWTTAAALPSVYDHDDLLDDIAPPRGDHDGRLARDARSAGDQPPAPRNPWVLDPGHDPYDAEPDHDAAAPHHGPDGRADARRDAADRRWSADAPVPSGSPIPSGSPMPSGSPVPSGAEPGGRTRPPGRGVAASGPAGPATPGSGADPAAPRIISAAAAPVTPRVISRSTPPAAPRVVSRSTPPATPRVISAGTPAAVPKTAPPAGKPPAKTTAEPSGGPPPGTVPRSLSEPAVTAPGPGPLRPAPPSPGARPGGATAADGVAVEPAAGAARQSWAYPAPDGTPGTTERAEPGDAQIIPLRRRPPGPSRGQGRPQHDVAAPEADPPHSPDVMPARPGTRPDTTAPHGARAVGTAAVPRPEAGYGSPAVVEPPTDVEPPPDVAAALHPPMESGTAVVPDPPGRPDARPAVSGLPRRLDAARAAGPAAATDPVESAAPRPGESAAGGVTVGRTEDNHTGDALRDAIAPEDLLPTALMPGPDPSQEEPAAEATPASDAAAEPARPDAEPTAGPAEPADEVVLAAIRWRLDGASLREVVDDRDELRELGARLDRPLSASDDNASRARLLCLRAEVYRLLDELGLAAAASRLALAHAEAAADPYAVVVAQGELAHVLRLRGDFAEADRLFEQAASAEVPELLRCVIHENAGRSCFDQGRYMEALDHFTRAIRLGDPLDLELVERIDVALEAVHIRVLRDGWGPYPRLRREIMAAVPGPDRHPAPRSGTALRHVPEAGTTPVTVVANGSAGPPAANPAHDVGAAPPIATLRQSESASTDAAPAAETVPDTIPDAGAPPPVRVPAQTQRTAHPLPAPVSAEPAPATPPPVAVPPAPAAVEPPEPPPAPAQPDAAAPGSWFVSRT